MKEKGKMKLTEFNIIHKYIILFQISIKWYFVVARHCAFGIVIVKMKFPIKKLFSLISIKLCCTHK